MPTELGVAADLPTQARCLTGRNACAPEAVGGLRGYDKLRRATADPEHEIQGDGRAVPLGI